MKKKIIVVAFILLVSFLCISSGVILHSIDYENLENGRCVITYSITNLSAKNIVFPLDGNEELYRLNEKQWVQVPLKKTEVISDVGVNLRPGKSKSAIIYSMEKLEKGTYKVCSQLSYDGKKILLEKSFEVE